MGANVLKKNYFFPKCCGNFLNLSLLSETDLVAVVEDLSTKCSGDTCSAITTDFLALVTNHDAHSEK